jgi:hypothetical protein
MKPRLLQFQAAAKPEVIREALRRRAAAWREDATPPSLRKRGIQGCYLAEKRDGRFQLYWNYPGRMAYRVVCLGRITPEGEGSRVQVKIRLEPDILILPAGAALLMLGNMAWTGNWDILRFLGIMVGVAVLTGLVWLLSWHPGRAEEEASELETIIYQASGPLLASASTPAAV